MSKNVQEAMVKELLFIVKFVFPLMLLSSAIVGFAAWMQGMSPYLIYGVGFNLYVLIGYMLLLPVTIDVIRYPEENLTEGIGWQIVTAIILWPYCAVRYLFCPKK